MKFRRDFLTLLITEMWFHEMSNGNFTLKQSSLRYDTDIWEIFFSYMGGFFLSL